MSNGITNPLRRRHPSLRAILNWQEKQPDLRLNFGNIGRKYSGGKRAATRGVRKQTMGLNYGNETDSDAQE